MVKLILKITILFLVSLNTKCNQSKEILFDNEPFSNLSDMLRTDGYYQRTDSSVNMIEIFVFFKNGKLLHNYFETEGELDNYFKRDEIILKSRHAWGAFSCKKENISIEYYVPLAGNELTSRWSIFKEEGKIIDSNTLLFTKGFYNKKTIFFNDIYKFKRVNIPTIKSEIE